ncbi:hypothetical protein, partial [Okeania sp. SIO2G5]|uniref:hypothetical protein n=1 Tax=Okeania sp. SIO2G5 TaxID=2607796 RepID=UPI0035C8C66A
VRLLIRDNDSVLVDERFEAHSSAAYLYGQVLGGWDETFTLDIFPPNATEPLTLPTFRFQPEA